MQDSLTAKSTQTRFGLDTEPGGGTRQSSWKYLMSDKQGHLARWRYMDKATTLQAGDYKDPQAILVRSTPKDKHTEGQTHRLV